MFCKSTTETDKFSKCFTGDAPLTNREMERSFILSLQEIIQQDTNKKEEGKTNMPFHRKVDK